MCSDTTFVLPVKLPSMSARSSAQTVHLQIEVPHEYPEVGPFPTSQLMVAAACATGRTAMLDWMRHATHLRFLRIERACCSLVNNV